MFHSRRLHLHVAGLLLVCLLALVTPPAAACGCGAYLPREGEAHVVQERALIRWDGHIEDIVLALDVAGRSREAAWILPVPAPATVQLADPRLFITLQRLTHPIRRVIYLPPGELPPAPPTGGEAPPPVQVLARQALGPFEVTTLAATEATALSDWLAANGYAFPPGLPAVLEAYVAQRWSYVAVRLVPAATEDALSGQLDPLWVTFESDQLIYPMRMTALATGLLPVFLYVLAEHRIAPLPDLDPHQPAYQPAATSEVSYAQWIAPTTVARESPLAPFVTRRLFLTKFDMYVWIPEQITEDLVMTFAPSDRRYHQIDVRYASRDNWRSVLPPAAPRTGPSPTARPPMPRNRANP